MTYKSQTHLKGKYNCINDIILAKRGKYFFSYTAFSKSGEKRKFAELPWILQPEVLKWEMIICYKILFEFGQKNSKEKPNKNKTIKRTLQITSLCLSWPAEFEVIDCLSNDRIKEPDLKWKNPKFRKNEMKSNLAYKSNRFLLNVKMKVQNEKYPKC